MTPRHPACEPAAASIASVAIKRGDAAGRPNRRIAVQEEKRSRGIAITKMSTIVESSLLRAAALRRRSSSSSSFAHGVAQRLF